MKRKKLILIIIALFAAAVIILLIQRKNIFPAVDESKCNDELGCVSLGPDEPVKIAVLQPLTGRLHNSGTVQIRGIELALAHRNNRVAGRPVELIIEDSQCSPEGGAVAALKVIADPKIIGIIGPNCSGAAAEASKIMSEAGLVMISGTNSAASLTSVDGIAGKDWYPGYFRTMDNSLSRGDAAAVFAFERLGLRKAATIDDGDNRSIELNTVFEKKFTELGGEIVISTAIDRGDTNMRPVLTRITGLKAEIIFYPFFPPETTYLTRQAREVPGLEDVVLMACGSTMRTDAFIDDVGESGIGLYIVGRAEISGPAFDELKIEYEKRYSDLHDSVLYAYSFDAANILFTAMESVMDTDENGDLRFDRQQLRDAMYATSGYEGVTGLLSSDEFGDCGSPQFNILRLDDPAAGYQGLIENEVFRYSKE